MLSGVVMWPQVARIHKVELAQMKMAERERHDRELASIRDQVRVDPSTFLSPCVSTPAKGTCADPLCVSAAPYRI